MKTDFTALVSDTQENQKKLSSCKLHLFDPDQFERKLGQRMTCVNCSGTLKIIPNIMYYIEGYRASGGDVNDIWPGYDEIVEE